MSWEERIKKTAWMDEKDKVFLIKFMKKKIALGNISERRIQKYRGDLSSANSLTEKTLLEMIKDFSSLEKTIYTINQSKKYKWATKRDIKKEIGTAFNYLHNDDTSLKYAERKLKELITHKRKASDKRVAKPIIFREEIREMIEHCDLMDRALIFTLFETGMRCGEFVQLRKNHITNTKEGLEIFVPAGKTGERKVDVVECKKYLMNWVDRHPQKEGDAFVWVSENSLYGQGGKKGIGKKYTVKPLTGAGITKRIKTIISRMNESRKSQGIPIFTKPANPHNFRHSRASELGGQSGMMEQILCKYFGWEIGSDMPKIYLHLTDKQVSNAVYATYGKAKREEIILDVLRKCPMCHKDNPKEAKHCMDCGADFDMNKMPSKIEMLEERINKLEDGRRTLIKKELREIKRK